MTIHSTAKMYKWPLSRQLYLRCSEAVQVYKPQVRHCIYCESMECKDCKGRIPCHAKADHAKPYFTCIWCYGTLKNTPHRWMVHTAKCPKKPDLPPCICYGLCWGCLEKPHGPSKVYIHCRHLYCTTCDPGEGAPDTCLHCSEPRWV